MSHRQHSASGLQRDVQHAREVSAQACGFGSWLDELVVLIVADRRVFCGAG